MDVKIEAFETYPAGVYPVTVKEVTLDEDGQYGSQFRFKFELGGELQGKTMTGWCKQSGSVKSKFFEWYSALTGTQPKPGESVNTDTLIGKHGQVVINVKSKPDGSEKNVIESLLPFKEKQQQLSPAQKWIVWRKAEGITDEQVIAALGTVKPSEWLAKTKGASIDDAIEAVIATMI